MLAATGVVLVAAGQSPASIVVLSLTVVAASFVALAAYRSLSPLVVDRAGDAPQLIVGHTRAALEREKTLALRAIKELEFDFAMGKVSQADFDEMGGRLRRRAMGLMQQLDANSGYREQIEKELASLVPAPESQSSSPQASHPAPKPSSPRDLTCPACGTPNDADARFCKQCGTSLTVS